MSSSPSILEKGYDVFINSTGEDTHKSFIDQLCATLSRSGIVTFRDDPKLESREELAPELFKAIQRSSFSVIVLSKTYAFSVWCLEELAEIVSQKNRKGQGVIPVFCNVDPSDFRELKGKVGEAIAKHDDRYMYSRDTILRWRDALTRVAYMKGYIFNNKRQSDLIIGEIVGRILAILCQNQTRPVGESVVIRHLEELYSKIWPGGDDVRIIGICGKVDIGRTTIARDVYNHMSSHFETKAFVANVQQVSDKSGLVSLQKQLLSQILPHEDFEFRNVNEGKAIISHRLCNKKVLVVIDDVNDSPEFTCLVGRRDWFGSGSRIIVATRNEYMLRLYQVDDVVKPRRLNNIDAIRLFNTSYFHTETVPDDSIELSESEHTQSLPLLNSAEHYIDIEDKGIMEGGSSRKVWVFLIANFAIELLSAAFDELASVHKPEYALAATIMALVGLLGCMTELAFKGVKEKARWRWDREIPWFYCPTAPPISYRRFGNFADIFGSVCAVLQSVSAIVAYAFYSQHSDNPIKLSYLPIVFAIGLLFSRYLKDRSPEVIMNVHED